jgi:hypothetical protein
MAYSEVVESRIEVTVVFVWTLIFLVSMRPPKTSVIHLYGHTDADGTRKAPTQRDDSFISFCSKVRSVYTLCLGFSCREEDDLRSVDSFYKNTLNL